jgi:N-methylhydantoinase A
MQRLGVDTGGTFTDAVALDDDGGLRLCKLPTTQAEPRRAILDAVEALAGPGAPVALDHGTTHATNALLTGKLGRVVLVVTAGFRDLLAIGRQDRLVVHSLEPTVARPSLPPRMVVEVAERLAADGAVVERLSSAECERVAGEVARRRPEAVAVLCLHAWSHPGHEERLGRALRRALDVPVLLSSEVAPEIREVERGNTTWADAALMPVVGRALEALAAGLEEGHRGSTLRLMRSDGGVVGVEAAAAHPVQLALSGPAAGLGAATSLAQARGEAPILTLDMGGTSTDVAWVEGELPQLETVQLGGLELLARGLPIHSVGTGGGSLARIDAGGSLTVGPASAGARPGPACYGRGGTEATVTDAHLLLGRLPEDLLLGGDTRLDRAAAEQALADAGRELGLDAATTARQVLEVAQAGMERALRRVSLASGRDPREATLYSFGGAGGLHAAWLARNLEMMRVVVPPLAGVFSAVGLLSAPLRRTATRSVCEPLPSATARRRMFAPLLEQARIELAAEGIRGGMKVLRLLDLRVPGQAGILTLREGPELRGRFADAYRVRFGMDPVVDELELAAVRVVVEKPRPTPWPTARTRRHRARAFDQRTIHFPETGRSRRASLYRREDMRPGALLEGPAVVVEDSATTVVPAGWTARLDRWFCLTLEDEG